MALLETPHRHEDLFEELLAEVSAYNPAVDRELLARAFDFAARAHEGQERRSGEEFIHHPFGAAKICADLRLDDETIAAALLHDVVEDTDVGIDEVRNEFGEEIAQLVEGVTKLTRIHFQSREHAEAENYRKMIEAMVAERRADREEHVNEAKLVLHKELEKVGIPAEISGRAKHSYSIYDKMAKKGREFNEIYDLTAMRVIVERSGDEGTRDCYGALGLIHSLWKPMPGRFKDYVAMPKFNGYRALHTTVVGPAGNPLEIQIRTRDMHREAELGIAAHWLYKRGDGKRPADEDWLAWVKQLMEWGQDETDPREFLKSFRTDLFDDEVYLFTPKGEVKTLPAGSTPIDFAYAVHTDVGHRTVGAKVNGRIVPLHYTLR